MEIHHLRSFATVADTGNLSRASEQLHLTQSAISKHIKTLEEELHTRLFERTPAGMTLTSQGRKLLPLAIETIAAAGRMISVASGLNEEIAGPLRLGTIIDPGSIRLGALLNRIVARYPRIDIQLEHGISGGILKRVINRELDAGFYLGEVQHPLLVATALTQEHYVVAAPAAWDHRVRDADWPALLDLPWVRTAQESSQTDVIRQIERAHGRSRQAIVEADQESSMIEIVRSGVALCLMREQLATSAMAAGGITIWRGERIPCPLSVVTLRSKAEDAVLVALRECLRDVWETSGDPQSA
ncbi:LysR family transcriptional regulator [Paraburkholderia sp. ZP32-5]|uniref:LysR family transcriptional regulator n=1 Tax=Paraburkholderia sp. ZP32-5 TaxID=2883245 RepID=UPI001F31E2D3|nr:LysR family transcriptional regulator [Paraburkholderia sp. ZP32-5]